MQELTLRRQNGSSLVEVLVAVALFGIVGLGLAVSVGFSNRIQARTNSNSFAMQIALEGLESYSKVNPLTLTATTNSTSVIAHGPTTYTRSVTITVNSDASRTVSVSVSDNSKIVKTTASVTGTYTSQSST